MMKMKKMKTEQLFEMVSELGYEAFMHESQVRKGRIINIKNKGDEYGHAFATIYADKFGAYHFFSSNKKLHSVVADYVFTDVADREEPKKYYYRLESMVHENFNYLNYDPKNNKVYFDSKLQAAGEVVAFTDEHVENLPTDIQAIFKACKKEEVK